MKRTVRRWVHSPVNVKEIGFSIPNQTTLPTVEVEVAYDDGQTEPERCKCAGNVVCCQAGRGGCTCCTNSLGTRGNPCLTPDCPNRPQVRDRVVEGFAAKTREYPEEQTFSTVLSCAAFAFRDAVPATLTIHEPVKEMTLYEAVEAYAKRWGLNAATDEWRAVEEAFLREKAEREKGR